MSDVSNNDALYKERITQLMQSGSDDYVANGQPSHAAALYELFFTNAKKSVRILCHDLSEEVFGRKEVIAAATDALRKGIEIRILTVGNPSEENSFLLAMEAAALRTNNGVLQIEKGVASSGILNGISENFAVMDTLAFRFEDDFKSCKAVASMNNPTTGMRLVKIFDRTWERIAEAA